IVERCLEPDPARRWASVSAIASAIAPSHRLREWILAMVAALVAASVGAIIYSNVSMPRENLRLAILPFETNAADRPLSDGLLDSQAAIPYKSGHCQFLCLSGFHPRRRLAGAQ